MDRKQFQCMFGWEEERKKKVVDPGVSSSSLSKCFLPKMERKLGGGGEGEAQQLMKILMCNCTWASLFLFLFPLIFVSVTWSLHVTLSFHFFFLCSSFFGLCFFIFIFIKKKFELSIHNFFLIKKICYFFVLFNGVIIVNLYQFHFPSSNFSSQLNK